MHLSGVRRQLGEAKEALVESAQLAAQGKYDPAYRIALRSRNLLFHATRGLAAARGEALPEMPVVGRPGGSIDHHVPALAAIVQALANEDDLSMPTELALAYEPYAFYLGFLRAEVGRTLQKG